jgi:hypothetical protein
MELSGIIKNLGKTKKLKYDREKKNTTNISFDNGDISLFAT